MIPSSTAADVPVEVLVVVFFNVKGGIVVQNQILSATMGQNRQCHCGGAIPIISFYRLEHKFTISLSTVHVARLSFKCKF
jgi:hypothetical protein